MSSNCQKSSLPALFCRAVYKLLSIRSHQLIEHTNDGGRINKTSSDRVFGFMGKFCSRVQAPLAILALGSRRSWAANGSWLQLPSCSFTAHGNSVTNSRSVLNEVECSMTFVVVMISKWMGCFRCVIVRALSFKRRASRVRFLMAVSG